MSEAPVVLVVDDDPHIREVMRFALERAGYDVAEAGDGLAALRLCGERRPALVILDIMMPEMDGTEVCRTLRAREPGGAPGAGYVPIIFVSSRDDEIDRVVGLEVGGDDYLGKPFSPRELVARVKALLRRSKPTGSARSLEAGPLRVDLEAHVATCAGERLDLTPREFDLLAFLARHPGRALTRDELLRKVWGYDYVGETRTVDVHVRRLRAKLGEHHEMIETVLGAGYKLIAPAA